MAVPLDKLLLEQARESHATMVQSIDSLDSKSGSVVSVAAVLSGLIVAGGILSLREFWNPTQEAFWWLYLFVVLLALGVLGSFTALFTALLAWRKAEVLVIKPRDLTERFETRTEKDLRHFLIVQLSDDFTRMATYRKRTLGWLKTAFVSLGVSVVTLLVYLALGLYVLAT